MFAEMFSGVKLQHRKDDNEGLVNCMAPNVSGSTKIIDDLKNRAPTKGSIVRSNLLEYNDKSNVTMKEVVTYPNLQKLLQLLPYFHLIMWSYLPRDTCTLVALKYWYC